MLTDEELRNKILLEIKSLSEGQYMVVEENPSYVYYSSCPFLAFTVTKGKTRCITGGGAGINCGFSKRAISHLNQENCGRILMFDDAEKYLTYIRDEHIVPRLKKDIREKHLLTERLLEFSKTWSGKLVAPESSSQNEETYFIAVTEDMSDYYYMYWSPVSGVCNLETCCGYPRALTDKMLPKELEESMIKRVKETIFDAILPCNYREIETVHV